MHHESIPAIRIVAPEWFARSDFAKFVRTSRVATWHRGSADPGEWSDVFVTCERSSPGVYEGSDFDCMPEDIWKSICEITAGYGSDACLVWIVPVDDRLSEVFMHRDGCPAKYGDDGCTCCTHENDDERR